MRKIRFRGFCNWIDQKGWVYGDIGHYTDGTVEIIEERQKIRTFNYTVDKKSVGQYTGLYDKNGKEVYEGDILANGEVHGDNFYCVVEYQSDGFKGVTIPYRNHCRPLLNMMTDKGAEYNEVIGNIYENPELLDK